MKKNAVDVIVFRMIGRQIWKIIKKEGDIDFQTLFRESYSRGKVILKCDCIMDNSVNSYPDFNALFYENLDVINNPRIMSQKIPRIGKFWSNKILFAWGQKVVVGEKGNVFPSQKKLFMLSMKTICCSWNQFLHNASARRFIANASAESN
jgi:hypothetical protein